MSTGNNPKSFISTTTLPIADSSAAELIQTPSRPAPADTHSTAGAAVPLEADEIYYSRDFGSQNLSASLRYLREALSEIDHAQQSLLDGDALDADDRMNKTLVILQDVIAHLREAGEGFGIGAVALLCSIANLGSTPASEAQILAIKRVARKLIAEPYLSSEDAAEATLLLESVGLDPDSRIVQGMAEALGDA